MARRPGSVSRIADPIRSFWHRFAYGVLILGAFGILILGKADIVLVERVRTTIVDASAPILDFFSSPAKTVSQLLEQVRAHARVHEENEQLRQENARLKEWYHTALRLQSENQALRAITNFADVPERGFVTARVISDNSGPFVRSVIVDVGSRKGVAKDQAAITGDGVAGRVAAIGLGHARVLLITDLNSRIPVMIEGTRHRAILAGDNSARPSLLYLEQTADIEVGDRVVTSSDAGAFPPGLPVGQIVSVLEQEVRVQPFVDFARLDFLRLVDYRTAQQKFVTSGSGDVLRATP